MKAPNLEILLLCGSYHPGSANRAVLDAVQAALESLGRVQVCDSISLDSIRGS